MIVSTPPPPPAGPDDRAADPAPAHPANDGVLEARDIINIELRARLAVLSDGNALAMRDAAAAAPVLAWSWRAAGVPAVAVARWTAADPASETMLEEFYARLRAGDPPAAALREARARLRAGEGTNAPAHWAGWLLIGGV
jgi:CHAT domain-containing protein